MPAKKLKNTSLILCLLLSFFVCGAQKQVPDFGVFTQEEIDMKECEFDKDADAVILFDKAVSNYNDEHNLVTDHRVRFKILKERGIERGDIEIPYYSDGNFEQIIGIDAVVLSFNNNNQVTSKLERKSVFNKKMNRYYSQISFALPNIKVGSIVEYKYQSIMKHYGGLREWVFQKDMPVVLSSYDLTIVPNAEFAYSVYKSQGMPVVVKRDSQAGSVLFEMSNVPGLRDEAYMASEHDYLQRVKFQFAAYNEVVSQGMTNATTTTKYSTTWKELAKELMDNSDFGNQINKTLAGSEALQVQWATAPSAFAKMDAIHHYVRTHLSWNDIHSKYANDGVKSAWEKKTGSSGEINLILINLLKSAGLSVEPLLVSERGNGKVDTTYPYVDQFNKVVAYVNVDGRSYILDGTDRETPSFIIPFDLLNTTGFVVDRKTAGLIKIANESAKNSSMINILGTITDDGVMQLESQVKNFDYAKIERKEKYKSDRKKYERDFFEPYQPTDLDTFSVEGLDDDSLPISQNVIVKNYTLNKTGDYFLLNYNLFTGINKNPFMSEHRFSDINFGSKYLYNLVGRFTLPKNLTPESLPKSVRLQLPDKSMAITRQLELKDNTIGVLVKIDISRTEYTADEYPEVQAFYKQMLELLNEPVVLKSK